MNKSRSKNDLRRPGRSASLKKVFLQTLIFAFICFQLTSCDQPKTEHSSANLPPRQNPPPPNETAKKAPTPTPSPVVPKTPDADNSNQSANPPANYSLEVKNTAEIENSNAVKTDINPTIIGKLKIPVAGVRREDLRDTFKDSRSEGRVHDAIDIMAAEGTPVVAAADGEIARFFDSERGGITIYQFSADKKLIFYYAHLKRRADNLQEKMPVKQGQVIGYVGDTGNSGTGNFHLHFAIWYVTDPNKYWDGLNINPYPLLK